MIAVTSVAESRAATPGHSSGTRLLDHADVVIDLGTPIGDALVVITQEKSWKVRRIRNTPRVTIAVCDRRGNPKGEAVEAVAAILPKSANAATYDAIGRRYGLLGRTFNLFSRLRGGMRNNVSIQLKPVN